MRQDRVENQTRDWKDQMSQLVAAYLDYKLRDRGDGTCCPPAERNNSCSSFTLDVVDMFCESLGFVLLYSFIMQVR